MAVTRSSSGGVAIRYALPFLWITSYLHIGRMSIPLQCVTSLCRRAQANASAATYWLRLAGAETRRNADDPTVDHFLVLLT